MLEREEAAALAKMQKGFYNTYRTCPVHFFGQAGTNLGRAAGRDRFPLMQGWWRPPRDLLVRTCVIDTSL